jgi:hypothetical protein
MSLTPVCRETAYGLTSSVDIQVENLATLCGGMDLPDCEALFQQMIDQIVAQTPGLIPANVIVSNAGCSNTFAPTASPTP